ncbi:MAG TPA: hypothetical protein PLC42_01610 [Parachlamydiaceae bacterium]|nr:hypothetical protein [Parachlamydiaceae bacterium]
MITKEQYQINENLIVKLYADHKRDYEALHNFRREIEVQKSGQHHKPYQAMIKKTLAYRFIFMSLGALFFFFFIFMWEQSINWLPYSYIFSNSQTAKNVMLTFCLLLSCKAFGMCLLISPEKEALYSFTKRAKKKLLRTYKKERLLLEERNATELEFKKFNEMYHEMLEKVAETKNATKMLLYTIFKIRDQKKMIRLANEALLEANDHLHVIINRFRKFSLKS